MSFILFIGSFVVGFVSLFFLFEYLNKFLDNKEDWQLGLKCVIFLTLTLIFFLGAPFAFHDVGI
jgi:hypothetical protein